ncbi:DUF4871 domain-containing protein [Bacillus infantis]|uniref:DUF4871 domain-containing protein n=1 Tax=Bacillus infantis TaxID=324767 RepID=A0A5D4RJE7_9BACI|nr:DUF4871 domain-containing protein [Bacillus infantis]TYS51050.1 DUF4871 domain-containing protein [Bacillus infantis]
MKKLIVLFLGLLLIGCSNTKQTIKEDNWEESATLVREVIITDDGQKGEFVFRIGDNGKLGFGEYGPFIAGQSQKYMWHFWGEEKVLTKPFKVMGISKETGEEITVFQLPASNNLVPNTGADHHLPSSMMLPSQGLWRLEAYFDDKLFGNVVVNVEEQ